MRILVCDFPTIYRFPENGYGSTQRWLATVAKYAARMGHETLVSGPLWDVSVLPGVKWWEPRLDASNADSFLARHGRVDVLVAGHEAFGFGSDRWERGYLRVADRCVSYQHGLEQYETVAYDGETKRLYGFSDEIVERFGAQRPAKLSCYAEGIDEEPVAHDPEGYLVWIGRLEAEKATHHAIDAARLLGRRLVVMGEPVRDFAYVGRIEDRLSEPHVERVGTLVGRAKMECLARASCLVYTCPPDWIEAAAAVLWEGQLCGVPLAGNAWRAGTAVEEAASAGEEVVARVAPGAGDPEVAESLAEAIEVASRLDRDEVREYARAKFDGRSHVEGLLGAEPA